MDELLKKFTEGHCTQEEFDRVIEMFRSGNIPDEAMFWMKKHWYSMSEGELVDDTSIDFSSLLYRIHHDINMKEPKPVRTKFLSLINTPWWLRVAAVLVVMLMTWTASWFFNTKVLSDELKSFTVSTIRGQSGKISLPDGSEVWLNGKSSVTYNSSYGLENRNLILEGEGYFSVEKNASLPFMVQVEGTLVTAIGTGFNIDATRGGGEVVVTMESGTVAIDRQHQRVEVTSGQQAIVTNQDITVADVDYEFYTLWRKGQLIFKNETLSTITEQLGKMYDVKFVFISDTLMNFRYRGAIRLDNSVLKALEMLKLSTGLTYKIEGGEVILDK